MTRNAAPDRRQFLSRTAATMTALSWSRVWGANDRVRVGNIGCGRRNLLRELITIKDDAQVEIAAVCDTWRLRREKAVETVKEFTGGTPFSTAHMADVLARKDIDAVVIGTPDHLHCTQLIEAIRAGKHVYVEKPLAMNMKELIRAYDTVKKSDRIVQMGTQMRSYAQTAGAKEFLDLRTARPGTQSRASPKWLQPVLDELWQSRDRKRRLPKRRTSTGRRSSGTANRVLSTRNSTTTGTVTANSRADRTPT